MKAAKKKLGFVEKDFAGDESYVKATTIEGLDKWAKLGGWDDAIHFCQDVGIHKFSEIKGLWFTIVHNRLFFKD